MADSKTQSSGVAERYALALFDLAREEKALDAVAADLDGVQGLIDRSPDFQRLVMSPVFSAREQTDAVAAVLSKAGIGGFVANFLMVVARNRRLFAVPAMIRAFREMLARHRGEVSAVVTSAEPLGAAHVADLKAALKAALGKDVALEQKVDPALLGGMIVQVGSRMIDSSLRSKLNALKFAMKEVG